MCFSAQKIDSTPKPLLQPLARGCASQPKWTTQRFNGVDGRRLAFLGVAWRGASAPGVNRELQMRSLALSTVGEFEKERTHLGPKSDFLLAWEIGCVAWECVKTCKSVCHTEKPWELAALVQLSSVDNNYASLNIRHILRCSDWL